MAYAIKKTAPTWDSYKKTLNAVLYLLKPKTVLEFGPGESTMIMAYDPGVELIDSVEHDIAWFHRYQDIAPEKCRFYLVEDLVSYPYPRTRLDKYDLVFVDGRERERCLLEAIDKLNPNGVVILHDAERTTYQEPMSHYTYRFFQDDGHTAVLTNSDDVSDKLDRGL